MKDYFKDVIEPEIMKLKILLEEANTVSDNIWALTKLTKLDEKINTPRIEMAMGNYHPSKVTEDMEPLDFKAKMVSAETDGKGNITSATFVSEDDLPDYSGASDPVGGVDDLR